MGQIRTLSVILVSYAEHYNYSFLHLISWINVHHSMGNVNAVVERSHMRWDLRWTIWPTRRPLFCQANRQAQIVSERIHNT